MAVIIKVGGNKFQIVPKTTNGYGKTRERFFPQTYSLRMNVLALLGDDGLLMRDIKKKLFPINPKTVEFHLRNMKEYGWVDHKVPEDSLDGYPKWYRLVKSIPWGEVPAKMKKMDTQQQEKAA